MPSSFDGRDADEVPLAGGLGSGGSVVRVGDTVRRPERPFSATVRTFLAHLHQRLGDAVPEPRGIDSAGREVLSFIDGDAGVPPFPRWTASETLLVSVAKLQRRLHAAAADFVAPLGAAWQDANMPVDAPAGALVCHNDLCIENVVVRRGRAVGFIDFDFAAPALPLADVAIAIRHWLPAKDPVDVAALYPHHVGLDPFRRFALYCDVFDLPAEARAALCDELVGFLDRALVTMRTRYESGMPGYVDVWRAGYEGQNRRSVAWVSANREALAAARVR